jgi:SpoVK/Ycf46/Vps4 family AAA+-type ATPase
LIFREDLRQRFDLRPRVSLMMTGPTGTGKTMTIKAFLTLFGKMVAERSGRNDLGSRTIRVKASEQLSEWLGRSDKNFEALFDDIRDLAAEEVETSAGERIRLPVVLILEEVESIARKRSAAGGDGAGGALDRILGTVLQRLDDPMAELAGLPLVIISTSNQPAMIDVAMQRRLGLQVARFSRLRRQGLAAVLSKKVKSDYPLARRNGTPEQQLRQDLIDQVVANLFDPQNDPTATLEITLGDGTKIAKYPRDFLTGALVEQALSEAIDEMVFLAEETQDAQIGLDSGAVIAALRRQVGALAENVATYNASDYVDLPEHTHVSNVRRLANGHGHVHQLVVPPEE